MNTYRERERERERERDVKKKTREIERDKKQTLARGGEGFAEGASGEGCAAPGCGP